MHIYNRYIYQSLFTATVFVSLILVTITMLTQSLRFLELIVESGASTWSFWMLTFLALPRFFEVIIPIGLATSVLFLLNKLSADSEISVLKATGFSHWQISRPMIIAAIVTSFLLLFVTFWLAPTTLSKMQLLRQVVKTELSAVLFREGVFTNLGKGLTFYIRERGKNGELNGLVIHDTRDEDKPAMTIYAQRGVLTATSEGQKIVVFDGARQDYDADDNALQKLNFQRYTIDLPEDRGPVRQRWREPDERTFWELLNPNLSDKKDTRKLREFKVEAHKRFIGPFFAPVYCLIAVTILLTGAHSRHGQMKRIISAISLIVLIQSLYIVFSESAQESDLALAMCYIIALIPTAICLFFLLRPNNKKIIKKST